jgi:hypothetical protein
VARGGREALGDCPAPYQADREIVLTAIRRDPYALDKASAALQNDTAVVLAAVTDNGRVLISAGPAPRGDKEVVMRAVTNCGYALLHASAELKNDPEVVLLAAKNQPRAIKYASLELLRNDPVAAKLAGAVLTKTELGLEEERKAPQIVAEDCINDQKPKEGRPEMRRSKATTISGSVNDPYMGGRVITRRRDKKACVIM